MIFISVLFQIFFGKIELRINLCKKLQRPLQQQVIIYRTMF